MWRKTEKQIADATNTKHVVPDCLKWLKMLNERRVTTEHSLLCAQPVEIHFEHSTATLWQTMVQHRHNQGQSLSLLFSQTVTALRHGRFHLSRSDSE